jgi:hypothetical protein
MNQTEDYTEEPKFEFRTNKAGELVVLDRDRKLEISQKCIQVPGGCEITLFAYTFRSWDYPHDQEPFTPETKRAFLLRVSKQLESEPGIKVKIEW